MAVNSMRDHRDQDGGDDVAAAAIAQHAENRHRRDRLDDDDAVKDQIPKREGASKPGSGSGSSARGRAMNGVIGL